MFLSVTEHQGSGGAGDDGTGDEGGTGNDGDGTSGIRTRRRRRALRITGFSLAGLLALGAGAAGWAYWQLNGNIRSVDINGALGDDRPVRPMTAPSPGSSVTAEPLPAGSLNILVLGSDSRSGAENRALGGGESGGARSDTAMVVHLDAGRTAATVVSIPRDTLVYRPACAKPRGGTAPAAQRAMFNSAYAVGGPACAVKTVEKLTGLRMDHYVEVDFTGFKNLVDSLGGVPLTTTQAIRDPKSHLDLDAGSHTLNGDQALGLVRTRHGIADGSDLGRIQLQQAFLKALMDRVRGLGLLTSPTKLFSVADTATSAVTTDTGLGSVGKLMSLAQSVRGLRSGQIHMVTLPVRFAPADRNRVEPIPGKAAAVWAALRADKPVPASALTGSAADRSDAGKVVGPDAGQPAPDKR